MKTIIAGSRGFTDYNLLHRVMSTLSWDVTEVVSGMARGADMLGERWAIENEIPITRFHANWDGFGRSAGHVRNAEMAKYADAAIVFWDGDSHGSKGMIALAKKKGMNLLVILYPIGKTLDGKEI